MTKELIKYVLDEKEIAKQLEFEESVIAELSHKYMTITVKGIDDKEGYEAAHTARMDIVRKRTDFTKKSKKFRDELNEWPKMELKFEKRIISLLEPIEEYLLSQEKIVDDEKARIEAEKKAKVAAVIQSRIDLLFALGCTFDGKDYFLRFAADRVSPSYIQQCSPEQFQEIADKFTELSNIEKARIEKETADKKAEEERLEKVRQAQADEFRRLAAIADANVKKEAQLKEAQDKIDAEKKRIARAETARLKAIADKEALEIAKKEAAEKAVKEAEEKRLREEKAKAAQIEKDRVAAEKKRAKAPDKEKLLAYAFTLDQIPFPDLKTKEGQMIGRNFNGQLAAALKYLKDEVEAF